MPQHHHQQQQHKKKKKGRAPAHQNTFAYAHNPKSKKTATILANPIQHVCRRCHEKLEWRKQYRKYKPRTVPGKCNLCQKRNVLAAYHTVCESCTRVSNKAVALLEEWNRTNNKVTSKRSMSMSSHDTEQQQQQKVQGQESSSATENAAQEKEAVPILQLNEMDEAVEESRTLHRRVCAMCVKEPALPDQDDDNNNDNQDELSRGRQLRLRERKTLERKQQQQQQQQRSSRRRMSQSNDDDADEEQESVDDDNDEEQESVDDDNLHTCNDSNVNSSSPQEEGEREEEADPFLLAVGGADKLLTGEAYQQMLLEQERLRISSL